ncbi:UDP-2-acetamido-2,6-beta-L-arabino-hexul-4-ose reductase [Roseateles oligotrophus]|uniref:NAD-dependent epimerase/dehydratase family protein n=1 Tax=Roseateles oligotrophus TaxID=1769250 RepID=A0ABT2YDX3_9BURK|nr:NAD-dependent epimerase/dehydratase family protein [Roseateles oligotrophus]MCV2368249.1 NAD-dependent epimerase/dehydratase family protein [Roseateles oligotrophus]
MRIAITGARGFIGSNLQVRLQEMAFTDQVLIPHDIQPEGLRALLNGVDFVFHLAGVNRPKEASEFDQGNHSFTRMLCEAMTSLERKPRVAYSSSTQALYGNPYGLSKRQAEDALFAYGQSYGVGVYLFRLTNVFGKWSRPNYNSAVATFCHNIARGLPITINDPNAPLRLVYVDDVLSHFCALLGDANAPSGLCHAGPEYETTVGELGAQIQAFRDSRDSMVSERVGTGLTRALYSTYVSFLPVEAFDYQVARYEDPRGVFVEMLKTPDCGQFSYFTAHPGITRGEHYHHSKTEKFLVIKGKAHFGFRHIVSNETHEIVTQGGEGRIVETVPGWTHNITNIGDDEMIVMLWANEIFDRQQPDTVAQKVSQA